MRLRFIDLARTVAILLMLEGHFVDLTLAEDARRPGWLPYDIWHYVRGMTAPIFFTVTGLVFSFLLCRHAGEPGFFRLVRVRKGLVRACELLFWGYAIQLDLGKLPSYLDGEFGRWAFAFHVLQCIGAGLLVMIGVFGLRRWSGRGPTWVWFVVAAFGVYLAGLALSAVSESAGFPSGAPDWLRNPFKGPGSVFPVAPWLAFTLYGAAAGSVLRHFEAHVKHRAFPLVFIGIGFVLSTIGWRIDRSLAAAMEWMLQVDEVQPLGWFHLRAGEAFVFLGLLMAWENFFGIRESRFLTIGRNTFPIYVVHVIVLYGGLFGIGLRDWLRDSLTLGQALFGALLFMGVFAVLAQVFAFLTVRWREFCSGGQAG